MPNARIARFGACAGAAVAAVLLGLVAPAFAAPTPHRVAGGDPVSTSVAVSRAAWSGSARVVVVGDHAWPDALAAAALDAPILLTPPQGLPGAVADEIRRLRATEAVVVGGTATVGPAVRQQLRSLGVRLVEIAGRDRYETAGSVATLVPDSGDVAVVSGDGWGDAASIAPWAAARHAPILLTRVDTLHPAASRARSARRAVVVGGTSAVSDAVVSSLPNPVRLSGPSRYATSAAVAGWTAGNGLGNTAAALVPGEDPTTAIVGAALAGHGRVPALLAPPGPLPLETQTWLVHAASTVGWLSVVGRVDQVGEAAAANAVDALKSADLTHWTNAYRGANGLPPITRERVQTDRAISHALSMMRAYRLYHQPPACATWGEAVGHGDPRTVFDMWTQSPGHRAVLLQRGVTLEGTAVLTGPTGRRWVVLVHCG